MSQTTDTLDILDVLPLSRVIHRSYVCDQGIGFVTLDGDEPIMGHVTMQTFKSYVGNRLDTEIRDRERRLDSSERIGASWRQRALEAEKRLDGLRSYLDAAPGMRHEGVIA